MRLAFLLLVPGIAFGQPFIGEEIASAPIPARTQSASAPAIAMARDERGIVIAWTARGASEFNRLYVARLDGGGHVVGAVHEIPTSTTTDAVAPSIAKSAVSAGFVLAWLERDFSSSFANYCRLDSELNPSAPQQIDYSTAPALARSGRSDWIATNGFLWRSDGGPFKDPLAVIPASDMVVAGNDLPLMIGGERIQHTSVSCGPGCAGGFPWGCSCFVYTYSYTYEWKLMWLNTGLGGRGVGIDTTAQPAIQSNGRDVLVALFDADNARSGAVIAKRIPLNVIPLLGTLPEIPLPEIHLHALDPDAGQPRPDIATDGDRYVVVWRAKNPAGDFDVSGAVIDANDRVTFLPIATSAADELDPSIIYVGAGRFLVAYEKITGNERRLAGRFIDFGNRNRVVH